jgi:hypothetical protein
MGSAELLLAPKSAPDHRDPLIPCSAAAAAAAEKEQCRPPAKAPRF